MNRPRAADDFATIRARMEELRREQETARTIKSGVQASRPPRSNRPADWSQQEISAGATGPTNWPDTQLVVNI